MMALLIAFALGFEDPQSSETKAPTPEEVAVGEVLQKWEKATAETKKLEAAFDKYQYNEVFFTEKRGKGTLTYTSPDQATFRIEPAEFNGRAARRGWRIEPCVAELLEWTANKLCWSHPDSANEPTRVPLPLLQGGGFLSREWIATPGGFLRPFLAGFDAAATQKRYTIRITQRKEREIWLEFIPKRPVDLANFNKLNCILDAQSFQPKAMRFQEPGEGAYHVYVFKEVKAN